MYKWMWRLTSTYIHQRSDWLTEWEETQLNFVLQFNSSLWLFSARCCCCCCRCQIYLFYYYCIQWLISCIAQSNLSVCQCVPTRVSTQQQQQPEQLFESWNKVENLFYDLPLSILARSTLSALFRDRLFLSLPHSLACQDTTNPSHCLTARNCVQYKSTSFLLFSSLLSHSLHLFAWLWLYKVYGYSQLVVSAYKLMALKWKFIFEKIQFLWKRRRFVRFKVKRNGIIY